MEFTRGCVNLQLILQKICHPPIHCIVVNEQLKLVPSFLHGRPSCASICYDLDRLVIVFGSVFSALQLGTLFSHWREGNNSEEICIYTLLFALSNLAFYALHALQFYAREMCVAEENGLKLMKFRIVGYPSLRKIPGLIESLVYILFGGFLPFFAFNSFLAPFLMDYLPIKLITTWTLRQFGLHLDWQCIFMLDLISGAIYSCIIIQAGGNLLYLLLGIMSFGEAMQNLSFQLFDRVAITKISSNKLFLQTKLKNKLLGVEQKVMVVVSRSMVTFRQSMKLSRIMQILIRTGNQAVSSFVQTMLVMGVIMAACGGYVCIKLYNHLPLLIYLVDSFLLPLCLIVNFVLISLADAPHQNSVRCKHFWRDKLVRKVNRLQLQSCPMISYSFGFVENCRKQTALSIANFILNLVATLTLVTN